MNPNRIRPALTSRAWAQPRTVAAPKTAIQRAALRLAICRNDLAGAWAKLRIFTRDTSAHRRQAAVIALKRKRLVAAKIAYQTARLLQLRAAR